MGAEDKASDRYLKEIVHVLFKRKWTILVTFLLVLGGTLVGGLMAPRDYEASTIVMIKRNRSETPVSPSVGASRDVNARVNPDQDLKSEAALVQRRSLVQAVVHTLGPEHVIRGTLPGQAGAPAPAPEPSGPVAQLRGLVRQASAAAAPITALPATVVASLNAKAPLSREDQAIAAVSGRLKVNAVEGSDLIKISFSGNDQRFTHAVLDLLVNNYLERYLDLRATPEAATFFEQETQRLARDLRAAEDAAQQFELRNSITSLGRQREAYLNNALAKEVGMQEARSETEGLREKSQILRARLAQLPERIRTSEEYRTSPTAERMKARLLDLEMQRNTLLQKYTEQDRRVTDVEKEIGLLSEKFLAEPGWEFARETYGENPARNPLMVELISTEAQLIRLGIRAVNLEREMKDFSERLLNIDQAAYEKARFDRRIGLLEDAYKLHMKKYEEAKIAAKLDESRIVNVQLAEPVQVTPKPGGGLVVALLGSVVGMVAGVGLAFVREYFTDSFTTEDSVRHQLGVPVLGSISDDEPLLVNGHGHGRNGKNGHGRNGRNGHNGKKNGNGHG